MLRRLALATVLLPSLLAAQAKSDPARGFDAYADKAVRDWRAVGLAVVVVKDGQIVFAKGYGVRELGKPDPVDTNTRFSIGSTTKAITAAALGMLVDDGKVRWDDPVTKYLPGFQLYDPYVTREITVRDLLTHRAGLPNADFLWYGTDYSTAEIIRRMRYVQPAYSLRSGFIYHNVMYATAGEVVAAASGMPWAEFVRTRIFAPLGMAGSVPLLRETVGQPNVASPHFIVNDTVQVIVNASVDPVAAAGSIWSSVADMSKWARFMIDSGKVGGKRLLQPATWAELFRPQTTVNLAEFYPSVGLTKPHWTTYGLGWFQEDYAGRMLQFHTGSIDGMVAIIGLIPDERFGVYVLANTDHVELRHALMYRAIDTWLGTGTRDWSREMLALYGGLHAQGDSAMKKMEAARITGTQPSLPLDKYAGTYSDSLYGEIRISVQNGTLRYQAGQVGGSMEHWQYDTFRVRFDHRWQGSAAASFVIGLSEAPERLEVQGATFHRK
jgi:CubicO group peptidase (beta-lactamase class C family)